VSTSGRRESAVEYNKFKKGLINSDLAVQAVADFLKRRGHVLEVPEIKVVPNGGDMPAFQDKGDIFIIEGKHRRRLEVKGSSRKFTKKTDYPHPKIILCEVKPTERWTLADTPEAIWIVSKARDCAFICMVNETRGKWEAVLLPDGEDRGIKKLFWMMYPKDLLFTRIDTSLQG
jgi:hypothetical protein